MSQNQLRVLSCRSWEASDVKHEALNHELYPSWQLLQQLSVLPCHGPAWGQAVLLGMPWFSEHFTCIVGLLLFRFIGTIHRLQICSWHPAPFILQLAKPPACNESRVGKSRDRRDGRHRLCPRAGRFVFVLWPGSPASSPCFLVGRKPHRRRRARSLQAFLGLPHTLPGPNRPSCGSM